MREIDFKNLYHRRNATVIKSSRPSECLPGQSLSTQQLLDKFVRGTLPNIQHDPIPGEDVPSAEKEPGAVHRSALESAPILFSCDVLDVFNASKQSRDRIDRFRADVVENAKKQALNGGSQPSEPAAGSSPSAN